MPSRPYKKLVGVISQEPPAEWRLDLEEAPTDKTPYLVLLKRRHLGSHVHAASTGMTGNGARMTYVGGHFAFDVPEIVAWRPMVKVPEKLMELVETDR